MHKRRSIFKRCLPGLLSACAWLVSQPSLAATAPLQQQLSKTGAPVYASQDQASHVFGYSFDVLEAGRIERLGGYFSGSKEVIVFDQGDGVVAQATVLGNGSGFQWSALSEPFRVSAGQRFRVLVRAGADSTTAAAWSLSMPYARGGIRVVSLQQGWSASAQPGDWIGTVQALPEQHARGIVDIDFQSDADATADEVAVAPPQPPADPGAPTEPPVQRPVQPAAGEDPYPATPGVIDSFGQASPSGRLGMGFMAVAVYYRDYPRQRGECSREVHDRYWVRDGNGVSHPTWHPPVDAATGCRFAHEHGDDPRTSPNYAFAEGIPFGLTHGSGRGLNRHEDHVGHKVVVQSNWGLVDGNPQNGKQPASDPIRRTGISCDWLSKLHQGSWSKDALANNAHEYFLNLRCTDGVQLRLKHLVTFGPPELVTNVCSGTPVGQEQALQNPDRTSEAFPTGITATSGTQVAEALDGKREFNCLDNLVWKDRLEELWKSDGVISLPAGGFIQFSPYYVVLNPARYVDNRWAMRGASDAYVSSLDLCFDDNAAFRDRPMGFCDSVPAELGQQSSAPRQQAGSNPMNGTRRVIHPKNIVVYTQNEAGSGDEIQFCTDSLGRNARVPDSGACESDELEQLVSRSDRRQWGWSGSDVNAIDDGATLRGAGYLNEWVRDFGAPGIRYPN